MAHLAERLPRTVELNSTRMEVEALEIQEGDDGLEVRNLQHDQSRFMWNIAYPTKDVDDVNIQKVIDMYRVTRGGAHTFLWQDLLEKDYTLTAHNIGTGDGVTLAFQIGLTTTVGSLSHKRIITRPRSGTIQVYKAGVLQVSGYTVSSTTGIVTFSVAPTIGQAITVTCTYDHVVRFATPLSVSVLTDWLSGIGNLTIQEQFGE